MSRKIHFTNQQSAILDSTVSVAVSAGAGCGKTFVLTQRFLAYLRASASRPDPLSSIVAITFTEKAAREMRHRVRYACEQELLNCDAAEVDYWLNILRGLDTARISTIHSFCSTLLRRFAVEAGLDPAFGLLETSFGDTFARRSVREGIAGLLEARDPDVMQFVARYGIEAVFTKIRELLYGVQLANLEEFDRHSPESLSQLWRSHFHQRCLPRLVREFWDSQAVQKTIDLLRQNEPANAVMRHRRDVLLEFFQNGSCDDLLTSLASLRECAQVKGGGGKSAWPDEDVYQNVMEAFTELRSAIKSLDEKVTASNADSTDAASLALAAHRIVRAVADHHAARKVDESRLDFDDLLCQARNLLLRDHIARRRAAAGIELLMVDEFQDTDPVQADLVRLLCGDALATGRLFVVGDAKQSIYRFRRADPRVFAQLRSELPEIGRLPLTTNFRSQPAILRFVNYTFAPEIEDYEPLEPVNTTQFSPEPSIEFLFPRAEVKTDGAEERRRTEAQWIAQRISKLLNDDTPRVIDLETKQLRRAKHGDFAILFRTLSNVHLYEQSLVRADLPYYLAGGRAFFAQQEIHDVVHLCRWLDDPTDELSLVGILRSPFFGLDDDTILLLKPEKSQPLVDGLQNPPRLSETQQCQVRRAAQILNELLAKKDRLPLATLLTLAVDRTGYDAALLCEHLGERKLANLRKLIALSRTYDAGGPSTLSEFANRLREAVSEQADEEMAVTHPEVGNVIRLMTIHQAKGLEFPVVIIADMDWRRSGGDSNTNYHPQLGPLFALPNDTEGERRHLGMLIHQLDEAHEEEAEQLRLLYVAVTRAKDHLILSGGLDSEGRPHSSWMKLLARRFDLLTGLPAGDPYFGATGGNVPTDALPDVLVHIKEPESVKSKTSARKKQEPLREFRNNVANAAPEPLPPLLGSLRPVHTSRREWTVTELCEADWLIRENESEGRCSSSGKDAASIQKDLFGPAESTWPTRDYSKLVGTACHLVLERLGHHGNATNSAGQLDQLVKESLISLTGKADSRLHRTTLRKMAAFLASPLQRELTDAERVHREVEFRLSWPVGESPAETLEILGTVDCIFRSQTGEWNLIDYKIVENDSHDSKHLLLRYELQIALYAMALEAYFGAPPATARIARLGTTTTLFPIPIARLNLDRAKERVNVALSRLRGI